MNQEKHRFVSEFCFHPFQGRPLFGPSIANPPCFVVKSFHPFQGRPLFGHVVWEEGGGYSNTFPSLSGKTSIRTRHSSNRHDLKLRFPSLSGKTSIRTKRQFQPICINKKVVSIPFREDLYSDEIRFLCRELYNSLRFPSLSGKTSIRTLKKEAANLVAAALFPSLSGKTSIRT